MEDPSLTEEDCHKILEKMSPNSKLINFSTKSLKGEVEGYLSSHFKLTIKYETSTNEEEQTFFVKKLNTGQGFLTEMAKSFDAFTKETFFYQFYPKLEEMEGFVQFAPKCYLCKENLIVIEDLSNSGFKVIEGNKPLSLAECKEALKTLATYHGSFIAYEEKRRKKNAGFDLSVEYPKELRDVAKSSKDSAVFKYLEKSTEVILGLIDEVPNINNEEFKKLVLDENVYKNEEYFRRYKKTVLHCDLWSKNFMFQRKRNKIIDCRLIDFQLLNYSLPGYDLSLFLHANTSLDFRKKHKQELLHHYYTCLDWILQQFGVPVTQIISFNDLLEGLTLCEPSGKIFAINDSAIFNLPEEVLADAFINTALLEEYMIHKRVNMIVDNYRSNPDFKAWVDEELQELYEILATKKEFVEKHFQH